MAKITPATPGISFSTLPLRVAHFSFEPATSLLSRLAARNGAQSVHEFCGDLGFPIEALFRGEELAIAQLAQLAGCDTAALAHVSIRHLGRSRFRLREEIATTHSLQRSRIRICPRCVLGEAETASEAWRVPRHLQWKFVSVRSCPEHGCALVYLPAEKHTRRGRDFTAQLRQHFDFIRGLDPVPQPHSPFEAWLTRRILGERGGDWIDQMELNVATRACEVLGLLLERGSKARLTGHTEADWAAYAQRSYAIMQYGADALAECLNELTSKDGINARFFGRIYGPLIGWLNGRGLGDEFEPLRDVVRRQIFRDLSIVIAHQVYLSSRP